MNGRPIVVLDPGHGGSAVAAGSSPNNATGYNGLLEKTLTLEVALSARRALKHEADVRLTRTGDVNLGLKARADVARAAAAPVFVSLHFNGAVKPDGKVDDSVNGTEAHVATTGFADRNLLAQSVIDRVCSFAKTRNRGVKTNDLGVLLGNRHDPHTAAALVELSFLTNHAEADRLSKSAYRDGLGQAVAEGVRDFLARMSRATTASDVESALWFPSELSGPSPEIFVPSVVDVIDRGDAQYDWWGFNVESKKYIGVFYVFTDALKDRQTGLRVPCTAAEAQKAADRIRVSPKDLPGWHEPPSVEALPSLLLTPKLLDARWAGAAAQNQIADPCPQNVAGLLAEESRKLSKCLNGQISSPGKWVADPGKIWALTNQLGGTTGGGETAVNYGWHVHPSRVKGGKWNGIGLEPAQTRGQWVIQGPGTRHSAYHIDYSQILLLVAGWCQVIFPGEENPRTMKTEDVYRSKELAHLVTADGAPLRVVRQPFKEESLAQATRGYWIQQEKQYQQKKARAHAHALGAVAAGEEFVHCDLLSSHVARGDNLGLRWNAMSDLPNRIDVILHLHGFVGINAKYDVRLKTRASGIELGNRARPTLGLVPLGKRGGPSRDGTLATYGIPALKERNGAGANDLIRWALDRFGRAQGGSEPSIARRIYTAHSGGGGRLLTLLGTGHDPHELQLFDCFYEPPAAAIDWVKRRIRADAARLASANTDDWNRVMAEEGGALRLVLTGANRNEHTWKYSQLLADAIAAELRAVTDASTRDHLARFYRVERVPYQSGKPAPGADHNSMPKTYGAQFLRNAGADVTPAPTSLVNPAGPVVKSHAVEAEAFEPETYAFGVKPFPDRPAGAEGGSKVMDRFKGEREPKRPDDWNAREDGFTSEIVRGNFPGFLRRWIEIPVQFTDARNGKVRTGRFRVMPDVLSIGDDTDYVLAPLDAISAQRVADAFGCLLPTAKMVQAIYDAAEFQHVAIPRGYWKKPETQLKQASTWAYVEHDAAIKKEYADRGVASLADAGRLLKEGHKKIVVIYPGINVRKKLGYYGWFQANHKPIQGEENGRPGVTSFTNHPLNFADYSQGIRLVHPKMTIDKLDGTPKKVGVVKVLAHPVYCQLLLNEKGPLTEPRITVTR